MITWLDGDGVDGARRRSLHGDGVADSYMVMLSAYTYGVAGSASSCSRNNDYHDAIKTITIIDATLTIVIIEIHDHHYPSPARTWHGRAAEQTL